MNSPEATMRKPRSPRANPARSAAIEALVADCRARLARTRQADVSAVSVYIEAFTTRRWDLARAMSKLRVPGAEHMLAALREPPPRF